MNLPDDLVEPDLQNPELILKQDLLVPALYDALPKSNIPELISEDDDGSMIFILNGNGFDIGGYNGAVSYTHLDVYKRQAVGHD